MVRLAERQRRLTKLDIKFLDLPGERIPLEDGVVDTVVSTFTLCTIPGVAEALGGMGRVLKAGGASSSLSNNVLDIGTGSGIVPMTLSE